MSSNENTIIPYQPPKDLIENIQKWVLLDSKLKEINEKTKKMRDMKNELSSNITHYMKDNNLKNHIEISDGELRMHEKKEYTSLSFGFIEKCLKEIINDEKQIDFIIQYLKSKRETTHSTEIKRIYK
uniref:Uncharacterized protein n=1 Tax=viral metagenome TaxID=1070528 RepID=A0A6C0ATV3_9ZZZZ|tara:strand:+ start:21113 stop:21493 length:381 start_codon:yes stop_codon:yes gene_type:complete